MHLKLFGTHVVVANTAAAAKELFEKRFTVFSDRSVAVLNTAHTFGF